MEFAALRDTEQAKTKFSILNFGIAHFWLFKELNPYGPPGKLSSETWEQDRAGRSLRTLSRKYNSYQSLGVRNQVRKARD